MAKKINCAVIGIGRFGRKLSSVLATMPNANIKSLYDIDKEVVEWMANDIDAKAVADVDEIFSDKKINAVIVATPNTTHHDYVIEAAKSGKHVFCEKPMSFTVNECREMITAANENGVKLMIGHVLKFYSVPAKILEMVGKGYIGTPVSFNVERTDGLFRKRDWFSKKETVGGLLFQTSSHEFDFFRTMFGDVKEINVWPGKGKWQEILDFPELFHVFLRFNNGVQGHLRAFMSDPNPRYEGSIVGTGGTLFFDIRKGTVHCISQEGVKEEYYWSPESWSNQHGADRDNLIEDEFAAIRKELDGFLGSIKGEADPMLTAEAGLHAVELGQAGYISIAEKSPVRIPLKQEWHDRRAYLEI